MKLRDRLPERVTVEGRSYRVDLDFRNVLDLMAQLDRTDLIQPAREWHALRCVMRRPPRDWHRRTALLLAVRGILFPAQRGEAGPKVTDFDQDADLIRAAFRQHYGIDLFRDRVHWLEFTALLGALPEGSKYAEVLGYRARPLPKPTKYNREEREFLAKMKARWALHLEGEEAERSYQHGLRMMAESLLMLADATKTTTGSDDNG